MVKRLPPGLRILVAGALLLIGSVALGQGRSQRPAPRSAAAQQRPAQGGRAAPAPARPDAKGDKGDKGEKPKRPQVTGGYSWDDSKSKRRRRPRRRRRSVKYDPNAAHANFPGFRLLPDGSTLIWVVLDKRVAVDVRRAKGQVTYVLQGAQVYTRNNTHPLVTRHFRTPLVRMRLTNQTGGAHLLLELREQVEPAHEVVAGPRGMMVLKVRLPQPTRAYKVAAPRSPLRVGGGARRRGAASSRASQKK